MKKLKTQFFDHSSTKQYAQIKYQMKGYEMIYASFYCLCYKIFFSMKVKFRLNGVEQ